MTAGPLRPRAAIAVPLAQALLDQLSDFELVTVPEGRADEAAFAAALAQAEGLLVNSRVNVDRAVMASAPELRVISTMSVGVDHIDLDAARERAILVTITPVLSDAVADLVMALMIMLARRIPARMRAVAEGEWSDLPLGADLAGQVLLIVGLGRIGREVAARASAAKMVVRYVDSRSDLPSVADVDRVGALAEGLEHADFVSVHVDLNAGTRHLIGAAEFASMKPTAFLVNASRGGVVDQAALVRALADGEIAGAALDVLEEEPPRSDDPVLSAPNVIVLPHIGSATTETRSAMARCAVDNLITGLRTGESPFAVP